MTRFAGEAPFVHRLAESEGQFQELLQRFETPAFQVNPGRPEGLMVPTPIGPDGEVDPDFRYPLRTPTQGQPGHERWQFNDLVRPDSPYPLS